MRKNRWRIGVFVLFFLTVFTIFSSKLYYPASPLESINKKELVSKGKEAINTLVFVAQENKHDWYIINMDSSKSTSEIIQLVANEYNWIFVEQLGSGYLFERQSEQLIITTEMWSNKFQLVKIPSGAFK